ncbi:MAG TPA: M14-type cytosolic carboxypeptidase, partial [Pirellulales bacterium]
LIAAEPLAVVADFEGASVAGVEIDDETRTINFTPGGDPLRGWPCWWYFRIDGVAPGETLTLNLRGSPAVVDRPGSPLQKPLAASWAMPEQATFSTDGKSWQHTEKGRRREEWMVYTLKPEAKSVYVAWGPPYTPSEAVKFVREMSEKHSFAHAEELCRSRADRSVPLLHVMEGDRKQEERFGVWVQARQHAWESGSSWVAQGFAEWLCSDDQEAAWLRQHAEVFLVPVMDVDNAATGNGGKDAAPQDHNRDWSSQPHWNETIAAQKKVGELIAAKRMDVFLDLHNPAPGDPTFFYVLESSLLEEPTLKLRDRFIELAYSRISRIKPLVPMSNRPKTTGPEYHPLWRQISANWVSVNGNPHTVSVCLETIWNSPRSTTEGYRSVGANLAAAVKEFLAERPAKP